MAKHTKGVRKKITKVPIKKSIPQMSNYDICAQDPKSMGCVPANVMAYEKALGKYTELPTISRLSDPKRIEEFTNTYLNDPQNNNKGFIKDKRRRNKKVSVTKGNFGFDALRRAGSEFGMKYYEPKSPIRDKELARTIDHKGIGMLGMASLTPGANKTHDFHMMSVPEFTTHPNGDLTFTVADPLNPTKFIHNVPFQNGRFQHSSLKGWTTNNADAVNYAVNMSPRGATSPTFKSYKFNEDVKAKT